MSSNSMDEEESTTPPLLDGSNDDYVEACDNEINDIVPRLQRLSINERLSINDNEPMLPSSFCTNTHPSSTPNFEGSSTADSNEADSYLFVGDMPFEVAKAAVCSEKSLSKAEGTSQVVSTNMQVDTPSLEASEGDQAQMHQAKKKQLLDEAKETLEENSCEEGPLDLSPKRNLYRNAEGRPSSTLHKNKTETRSLMNVPEKTKHVNPETGEITEISSSAFPAGGNSIEKTLDQFADKIARDIVSKTDSIRPSYSAESSSDESHRSRSIMIDSLPDIGASAASIGDKRFGKNMPFIPPISGTSVIKKRRFGILQPPFSSTDVSKTNSSDEDYKTKAIEKDSPINSRRKLRKTVKSSPRSIALKKFDDKNVEKRPSPCKRKKTSSETMTETTGKIRKRSLSEHNYESVEKSHTVIRSRSLSPRLKDHSNPNINQPTENSTILQSRKRTNSDSYNAIRVKFRRSSTSSDDEENK